jgi:hypothetical protein
MQSILPQTIDKNITSKNQSSKATIPVSIKTLKLQVDNIPVCNASLAVSHNLIRRVTIFLRL